MRTISIDISELEYQKFGLKADRLSFSDFVDMVSRELSRQNLARTIALAEQYGLSSMSMDEISAEVNAVRTNNAAHFLTPTYLSRQTSSEAIPTS